MNGQQEKAVGALRIEGVGSLPPMEFEQRKDGSVIFRYCAHEGNYPGFDNRWREMTEEDRRATLRIGGTVANWLSSLEGNKDE